MKRNSQDGPWGGRSKEEKEKRRRGKEEKRKGEKKETLMVEKRLDKQKRPFPPSYDR